MRAFKFFLIKVMVALLPPIVLVGMTGLITAKMVEGKDAIFHPFLYLGPLALLLGSGIGAAGFVIVSLRQNKSNRLELEATDNDVQAD